MTLREANLTAASAADREPEIIESGGTARLHLTLATTDYDHVRDLMYGVVRPEGAVLTAFVLPVEEVFYGLLKPGMGRVGNVLRQVHRFRLAG